MKQVMGPMKSSMSFRAVLPLVLALGLITGCAEDQPPTIGKEAGGRVPEQEFVDYRLIETSDGVRQWVLESDRMQKFSDREDVLLVTVKMEFFEDGAYFSTLTSDSGQADLKNNDIHTWGDVVVVTEDGRRLECSELFFDNETGLITNDVFNRFTRGRDVTTGIGLEASSDLENVVIREDVVFDVADEVVDQETGP